MNPPDQTQRDQIVRQLDTSMLVEAAAGTGKTTVMIRRIVALINARKCQRDQLVAVTFTRKAAAQLQSRLREELDHAEECVIGTIHSFCARLLRERPVEANLDPDFIELDEEQDLAFREQAWVNFTNELYANDDPALDTLDAIGLTTADLKKPFFAFADYPDVEEWPAPEVPAPELSPVTSALQEYAAHIEKNWEQNIPDPNGTDAFSSLWPRFLRMMRSYDLTQHSEVAEILELFKPERKLTQKCWPNGKEQAVREHERWDKFGAEVAAPFLKAWRAHRYGAILPLLHRARSVYDRQRQQAGALNFQDLLLQAAKLLREHPHVRRYFRRRFTHLLVDEFQDTDPIQAEVLLLLTASDPEERDWRRCKPVPGSLFVVGDPKQSIYRFRRADIVTYNTVKDIITGSGGLCVTLSANFRSAPPIVDWVNTTFGEGKFFPSTATLESPAYVPLEVGTPHNSQSAGVFTLRLEGNRDQDVVGEEAKRIANYIRASGRPPGDFLIITRTMKPLSRYADALLALGIPHEVTGGSVLNEMREVALLHMLTHAVLEPDNPVAVVAALRSEVFGISDRELYAHRRDGGRFDWRTRAAGNLEEAFTRLRQYADWLATQPPMVALERIASEAGLFVLAAAQPEGNVAAGSLSKALELLRDFQTEVPTASRLVARLERWVSQKEKHDGAPAAALSSSAARIMNLHKVKGLQGKVVFLAEPEGKWEPPVKLHVDRTGATVRGYLAFYNDETHPHPRLLAAPWNWDELEKREKAFLDAEENRLFYVAATRAEEQLVISCREKCSTQSPWEPLYSFVKSAPELPDPGPQSPVVTTPVALTREDVAAARAAIAARWEKIKTPTYATRAAKPPATPSIARAEDDGMSWGSVIHLLLQTAMRAPSCDLNAVAVSALRANDLDDTQAAEAVAVAQRVMKSALWRRAQAARQRLVETPLVVAMPDGIVRGVVDLAFEETDGWVLVDYKTDREPPEVLLEKYRAQLESYRHCWQTATGQPVKELGLYATHSGRYVVLP